MFCSRCGLKVQEGIRYCQSCGQEVNSPATIPPAAVSAPVPAPLHYAGFWVRVVAVLIDSVVLAIPFFFVVGRSLVRLRRFRMMARAGDVGSASPVMMASVLLGFAFAAMLFLVLKWLYFAGMESSARQATLGKAAMSLRVTDLQGRRLTFGRATGRFFATIITGLIPLGIGFIMAGFTEKKQTLHDMMVGTLVLRNS